MTEPRFTEGAYVALINHHWDRRILGKRRIEKVYKNGNFILERAAGQVQPEGFKPTQWRPNHDHSSAHKTGDSRFHSREHVEPWDAGIETELAANLIRRDVEARAKAVVEKIEAARNSLTQNQLAALEVALGMEVGRASE